MKPAHIPESHRDLLDGDYCVALTTVMPDGQPQITPVWCNREGDYVLINTMRGFRKEKNMRRNPKVTLLAYDPKQPLRQLEIRGTIVEMTEEGALEHLDQLTQLYLHRSDARFFGDSVAAQLQATYVPVKVTIAPARIRADSCITVGLQSVQRGENDILFERCDLIVLLLVRNVTALGSAFCILCIRQQTCATSSC